MKTGMINRPCS